LQAAVKAAQKRAGAGFTVETVNPARMGGEEGAGAPPAFGGAAQRDEAEGAEAAKPSKKVRLQQRCGGMSGGGSSWVDDAPGSPGVRAATVLQQSTAPPLLMKHDDRRHMSQLDIPATRTITFTASFTTTEHSIVLSQWIIKCQ
jgi:hypothetical protein